MKIYKYNTIEEYFNKKAPLNILFMYKRYKNINIINKFIKSQINSGKLNKNDIKEIDINENFNYNYND